MPTPTAPQQPAKKTYSRDQGAAKLKQILSTNWAENGRATPRWRGRSRQAGSNAGAIEAVQEERLEREGEIGERRAASARRDEEEKMWKKMEESSELDMVVMQR